MRAFAGAVRHDRGGAGRARRIRVGEAVALGARHREEGEAGAHGAAVRREPDDFPRGGLRRQSGAGEQVAEPHLSTVSMPIPSLATAGNGSVGRLRLGGRFSSGATRSMILPHTSPEFQAAVWKP